jgi:hypothetical protein
MIIIAEKPPLIGNTIICTTVPVSIRKTPINWGTAVYTDYIWNSQEKPPLLENVEKTI